MELLREAAIRVYATDKYKSRGEFGELILHGVLTQEFGTTGALSKFWFKDASNDTVKGFDVVHVSAEDIEDPDSRLHLWLGEAKFYSDLGAALRDAVTSFDGHADWDYLRTEFVLVGAKVDRNAPYSDRLLDLLDRNTSLDEIFEVLHLPVLVTYDSDAVSAHTATTNEYLADLAAEALGAWTTFTGRATLPPVSIDLILIPLEDKAAFVAALHERLKVWQQI